MGVAAARRAAGGIEPLRSHARRAVESDSWRRADCRAGGKRSRTPLRRTADRQSWAAGFSRIARRPCTIMDARRDVVFALLGHAHRARFFGRPGAAESATRYLETFDLAGVSRDHAFDALAAALALPVATAPHLTTFSAEGPWRGETHRLCDRPGALARLLLEVAAAGAEQVILVSASSPEGRAHELSTGRAELRGRAGEQLAAFEAAGLSDVISQFDGRFAGLFVIRPGHNPLGPDFAGSDDRTSFVRWLHASLARPALQADRVERLCGSVTQWQVCCVIDLQLPEPRRIDCRKVRIKVVIKQRIGDELRRQWRQTYAVSKMPCGIEQVRNNARRSDNRQIIRGAGTRAPTRAPPNPAVQA